MPNAAQTFDRIIKELEREPGVSFGGGATRGFGRDTLRVDGKIFAMLREQYGGLVLKLPKDRVTELMQKDGGLEFRAGKSRAMAGWVVAPPSLLRRWPALARQAMTHVASIGKGR